jgi:hypothetical protein
MQINRDYDDNANGHDINSFLPLSYNEPRTGFKLYQDDWYRFYVNDHDFNLTVFNIEGLAEHPSYNMEFYYYNQTELLELPILANHHQALFFNNMNYVGYVYLKIMACPPYLLKNYDLIVHPYLTDEPEEPNSFRSQATPLGSDWDDFMANHSYLLLHLDTDWYSFTTTRSGQLLQVYMLFSTSRLENSEANNISVSFQLFNSKGELLANAIESMFTRVINITINESGQYYLRVSSPNNHRFGYIMFMEELFIEPVSEVHIEPNVYGEGIEITLCARSLPTNGHIEIYRDSQLLSNSTFTIPYRPSGGNYTMNLFFDGLEEGRYQYTVLIYATNDYCYNWFDGRELYSSPLLLRREFILTVGDPPNSQDDQQTDEIIEDDENQEDNNILEDNKSEDSGEDMINGYGYLGLIFGIGVIFVSFHLYRKKIY